MQFPLIMQPTIDFRNGRYQGQTHDDVPHGIGIFLDCNYTLSICQWRNGCVEGNALIIHASGRIFSGTIHNNLPQGLLQLQFDNMQIVSSSTRTLLILPLLNLKLQIQKNQIIKEQQYSQTPFSPCLQFAYQSFGRKYPNHIQYYEKKNCFYIGMKGGGLGGRVEAIEQHGNKNQRRSYLIRGVGWHSSEGILNGLGMKEMNDTMKGLHRTSGHFGKDLLFKYETQQRPKECAKLVYCVLKESLHYKENAFGVEYLARLDQIGNKWMEQIRQIKTERVAQTLIQSLQYVKKDKQEGVGSNITYDLETVKREIYQSAKIKKATKQEMHDYKNSPMPQNVRRNDKPVIQYKKTPKKENDVGESKNMVESTSKNKYLTPMRKEQNYVKFNNEKSKAYLDYIYETSPKKNVQRRNINGNQPHSFHFSQQIKKLLPKEITTSSYIKPQTNPSPQRRRRRIFNDYK